jgi:poly(glycerol-phosphate) alpha-glucosyltransferase
MNIVHFTHGRVNPFGESGLSRTVYYLNKYQKALGYNSQIWSVVDGIQQQQVFQRDEFVNVHMFPRLRWIEAKEGQLLIHFRECRKQIDIVHIHMMWLIDKNHIARLIRKLNIPYVVTTHGAYTADKISNVWWKKLPAKYLYELCFLNGASSIHAVCHEELSSLRVFGVKKPIFVVPNGIELEEIPKELNENFFSDNEALLGKTKFVWIGNLKPCKNIDGLMKAVTFLPEDIRATLAFLIIGPEGLDSKGYLGYLKKLSMKLKVDRCFHFLGPMYGQAKYDILTSCDVYIHPSWSEVISFAVLDAMACAKPCVISRTSNVSYLYRYNCFEMVEPYPGDIARGILEVLHRKNEWPELGAKAKLLIKNKLTWTIVTENILKEYASVIRHYESEKVYDV